MMDLGVAVSIYDEVSSYMARPVSVGALQMLATNVVDLITDVVLAVLAGIPVNLEGNGVGDFSFDVVANAGIASTRGWGGHLQASDAHDYSDCVRGGARVDACSCFPTTHWR